MPDLDLSWMYEAIDKHYEKQDAMLRASNKYDVKYSDLLNAYEENGLMGVYNLGMEHMYDYLKE